VGRRRDEKQRPGPPISFGIAGGKGVKGGKKTKKRVKKRDRKNAGRGTKTKKPLKKREEQRANLQDWQRRGSLIGIFKLNGGGKAKWKGTQNSERGKSYAPRQGALEDAPEWLVAGRCRERREKRYTLEAPVQGRRKENKRVQQKPIPSIRCG